MAQVVKTPAAESDDLGSIPGRRRELILIFVHWLLYVCAHVYVDCPKQAKYIEVKDVINSRLSAEEC